MFEEVDSPRSRGPTLALGAVLVLFAGLGLGRVTFGATAEDLEAAGERVAAVSDALDTATTDAGRLERRLAHLAGGMGSDAADRDHLVVALARAFDNHPRSFRAAAGAGEPRPAAQRLVAYSLLALGYPPSLRRAVHPGGERESFADLFDDDAVLTSYADGGDRWTKHEYDGLAQILAGAGRVLPVNARTEGRMVQSGDLIWVRYVGTKSSGVVVTSVVDDRIARQRVVVLHTTARPHRLQGASGHPRHRQPVTSRRSSGRRRVRPVRSRCSSSGSTARRLVPSR